MALFSKNYPPEIAERIPPGQRLVKSWPVLHYGPIPTFDGTNWDLELDRTRGEPRDALVSGAPRPPERRRAGRHALRDRLDHARQLLARRLVPDAPRAGEADAGGQVGDRPLRVRLHVEPLARGDGRRRRPGRVGERGTGPRARARVAAPARRAEAVRLEEREVAHRPRVRRQEQARLLGGPRLPHHAEPFAEERYSYQEGPRAELEP